MGPGDTAGPRGAEPRDNKGSADKSGRDPSDTAEFRPTAEFDPAELEPARDQTVAADEPEPIGAAPAPAPAPEVAPDLASARVRDDDPDRTTPYIGSYLYNGHDDEDDARHALAHQRGPNLWLPLIIFVALLVGGALIGRYLLPGHVADAAPSARPTLPVVPSTALATAPEPSLPALPTPPARPADALHDWAVKVGQAINVPVVAIEAYGYAQLSLRQTDPSCHLGWTTLAGIGEVQSHHGQAAGAAIQPNGRSSPTVVGPTLDGRSGQPLVKDTDAGAYDGDATFDRAMGPLLLLPSSWSRYAADADGDGILDPYDIDDAALGAAKLLCAGAEDLSQLAGWTTAVGTVRAGQAYAKAVFQAADSYGQQSKNIG